MSTTRKRILSEGEVINIRLEINERATKSNTAYGHKEVVILQLCTAKRFT